MTRGDDVDLDPQIQRAREHCPPVPVQSNQGVNICMAVPTVLKPPDER